MAVAEGRAAGVGAGPAGGARGGRPEIVFGLVGALGTDLHLVGTALASALFGVGYTAEPVRVSDLIVDADIRGPGSRRAPVTQLDERMDQGDALREALSDGGAAAGLAVMRISAHRHERLEGAALVEPGDDVDAADHPQSGPYRQPAGHSPHGRDRAPLGGGPRGDRAPARTVVDGLCGQGWVPHAPRHRAETVNRVAYIRLTYAGAQPSVTAYV